MAGRNPQINVNVDHALKQRLEQIGTEIDIPPSRLLRQAALAIIAYYDENGNLPMPLTISANTKPLTLKEKNRKAS